MLYICLCVGVFLWCVESAPDDWKCAFISHFTLSSLCTSENHLDVIKCESYLFSLSSIFVHFWTCFNINVVYVSIFFCFFSAAVFYLSSMVALKKENCTFNFQ